MDYPNWKMRLFMTAYRAWVLHGGKLATVLKQYGAPIVAASAAKKIYSNNISKMPYLKFWGAKNPDKPLPPRAVRVKIPKLERRLRRLERGQAGKEIKFHDIAVSSAEMSTTAGFQLLTGISQGDQSNYREGLKINLLSISVTAWVRTDKTDTSAQLCRIGIVKDTMNEAADPTITDIFETTSQLAAKEHDSGTRFKIYWNKLFDMSNMVDGTNARGKVIKYYKKFKKPIIVEYTGTGSTAASNGKNCFYMYYDSNLVTGGANPDIYYFIRLRFTD